MPKRVQEKLQERRQNSPKRSYKRARRGHNNSVKTEPRKALRPQEGSNMVSSGCPILLQEGAKSGPILSKVAKILPEDGLKGNPTAAPRGFQEGLNKNANGAQEKPQDGPRRPEEVAQEGFKRPSEGPKEPQDGPTRVQNDVPRGH